MKRILVFGGLLLTLLLPAQLVQAQPVLKWYAFSQQSTPGMIPARVPRENGQPEIETPRVRTTYYIYVSLQPTAKISLEKVWIGGKQYKASFAPVDSTPVVNYTYTAGSSVETTVMVPRTKLQVMQLVVDEVISQPDFKPSVQVSKMISKSALVVSYRYKGKLYYSYTAKIKALTPQAYM